MDGGFLYPERRVFLPVCEHDGQPCADRADQLRLPHRHGFAAVPLHQIAGKAAHGACQGFGGGPGGYCGQRGL